MGVSLRSPLAPPIPEGQGREVPSVFPREPGKLEMVFLHSCPFVEVQKHNILNSQRQAILKLQIVLGGEAWSPLMT